VRKGQSVVLAFVLVFIIALLLLIPFFLYYFSASQTKQIYGIAYENYQYLKQLQLEQIESGHPEIIYNGYGLIVNYTIVQGLVTPLNNLTIGGILYYNSTYNAWINVTPLAVYIFSGAKLVGVIGHLYSSIKVSSPEVYTERTYEVTYPLVIGIPGYITVVQLPSYIEGKPIILDTVIGNGSTYYPGNLFYLTPNGKLGIITPIPHDTSFQYTFNILTNESLTGSPEQVVHLTPLNNYSESPSLATSTGGYAVVEIPSSLPSQYNTLVITLVYAVNGNLNPNSGNYYGLPGLVIYNSTLKAGEPDNNDMPVYVINPMLDAGIYKLNEQGGKTQLYALTPYSYGLIQVTLKQGPNGYIQVWNVTEISPEPNYYSVYSTSNYVYFYNYSVYLTSQSVCLGINWNSMQYIGIRLVGFNISVLYFTYQFY